MKKYISAYCFVAGIALVVIGTTPTYCQDSKADNKKAEQSKEGSGFAEQDDIPVAEMPIVPPWYLDKNYWYSFRFKMSESLHDARMHFRKGELKAAKSQIRSAINWLGIAKQTATESSKLELQTVIDSLSEVAKSLDRFEPVTLRQLNDVFAKANLALARHHFAEANQRVDDKNLQAAARRLVAAADHLKRAANAANEVPSPIIGTFQDEYNPSGMIDQTLKLTVEKVEEDLDNLGEALKQLGKKLRNK